MSEAPSAGVPQLQMVQRMAVAATALENAAQQIAVAKKALDDVRDAGALEWMRDPGEYGWWSDTHDALKKVRKWARLIQRHALYVIRGT